MPYKAGERLPGERASRLGHLEVLKSPLVNKLVKNFEDSSLPGISTNSSWEQMSTGGEPLPLVFGIDGSMQPIESETPPYKRLVFVKTALLRIDQFALSKIDQDSPHPLALRDILADSALYHATVFPLRHVSIPGVNTYHGIRQIIFESIKDKSLNGEPMETLKWIAYEKWDGKQKNLPLFECPHCEETVATLPYDAETGNCPKCNGDLFLTDMFGFHQEMAPDSAPDTVATTYMNIHEVLLLFTGIRYYWEKNKDVLYTELKIFQGEKQIGTLYPQSHFHKSTMRESQRTSEAALLSNLKEDLFISMVSYQNDESATFVIKVNPLMNWMWIGGFIITIGVIIILIHAMGKKKKGNER